MRWSIGTRDRGAARRKGAHRRRRWWRAASTLNTSALTGESLPREVRPGEEIISGCINMTGLLRIKTTKEFGESHRVQNPGPGGKRLLAQIKIRRLYLPVCQDLYSGGLLCRPGPGGRCRRWCGCLRWDWRPDWETWIYRALTFLVASCPCALVISIPLSFFAGIGGASKAGVLVKGSNYLEIAVPDQNGCL